MQGHPWDHFPPGLTIATYVNASRSRHSSRQTFFPLTAVATAPALRALAFRAGYAPFPPFTGQLGGPPGSWAAQNVARLPVLLQPLGLWSGAGEDELSWSGGPPPHAPGAAPFVNRTKVALPLSAVDAGLSVLRTPLHWIHRRSTEQADPGLVHFWRRFMGGEAPPSRLYHAQGAQFGVAAAAIRRRPRAWYAMLREELARGGADPVASYYCELVWWYVFDADAARVAAAW